MNMVMTFRVRSSAGNFWTNSGTVSFSRRSLLSGGSAASAASASDSCSGRTAATAPAPVLSSAHSCHPVVIVFGTSLSLGRYCVLRKCSWAVRTAT